MNAADPSISQMSFSSFLELNQSWRFQFCLHIGTTNLETLTIFNQQSNSFFSRASIGIVPPNSPSMPFHTILKYWLTNTILVLHASENTEGVKEAFNFDFSRYSSMLSSWNTCSISLIKTSRDGLLIQKIMLGSQVIVLLQSRKHHTVEQKIPKVKGG